MVSNASQFLYFKSDLARNILGAQCYRTAPYMLMFASFKLKNVHATFGRDMMLFD